MFKCKYKVGLLNLNDCNEPTDVACIHCNRTVCESHRQDREEGPVCLECLAEKYPDDQMGSGGKQTRWRNRLFDKYHYHPHYYAGARDYRDQDYQTFDGDQEPEEGLPPEEADEDTAADFQDS